MNIRVTTDNVRMIFERVAKACSKEDSRPLLKTVNLEILPEGKIIATALDGYVLAQTEVPYASDERIDEKIVLNVLPDKLLKFSPVFPLTLSDEIGGFLQVSDGQQKQLMRLINGAYIDWRKVAHAPDGDPDPQPITRIAVNADILKLAVEIAGKKGIVRMKIGTGLQGIWCALGKEGNIRMLMLPMRIPESEWDY